MLTKLYTLVTDETNPYRNLAREEYLTMHTGAEECLLYLWQNRHTVVIGKNQNAWKECKISELEQESGFLARRLSGGGAVFHDLGNLNFTFIVRKGNYDIAKQLEVILRAVRQLGIQAEKTGRNDLTVEGRKFSGNAFYESGDFCYHHGTLLVAVDKENMSPYLNVSKEKLASKSVTSVKARVANLTDWNPDLTIFGMKQQLLSAFSEVYGLDTMPLPPEKQNELEITRLTEKYSSWDWKYGRKIPFQHQLSHRYPWGEIELQFQINQGIIQDLNAYTDAMDHSLVANLPAALRGCRYTSEDILPILYSILGEGETVAQMKEDIGKLILEHL